MHSDTNKNWFAVMVKPRFERTVSNLLREKGQEEFLPLLPQAREWSDRVKTLMLPMFPRYVFCRFAFDRRVPILNTPGVTQIVGFGGKPCPIPDEEIASLQRLVESPIQPIPCDYLPAGEAVLVKRGPLAGLEGVLVENKSLARVVVSIHLLQRSVCAEVDRDAVVPVEPRTTTGTIYRTCA